MADHAFPMRGRSGGTPDIIKLAEHLNAHDSGTSRGERCQGDLAESFRHIATVQHLRSGRRAREVANLAPAETPRRRPRGGSSGGYQQGFATQVGSRIQILGLGLNLGSYSSRWLLIPLITQDDAS